jgi:glutamate carboxypeptidase
MMNPRDLPFDASAMLAGLRTWVECESPTFDAAAVNRMMRLAARDLAIMGARIEVIPGRMGFGDCVRARFAHPSESEPGIRSAPSRSFPGARTARDVTAPVSST